MSMSTSNEIKKELKYLLTEKKNLIELAREDENIVAFGTEYQRWYSRAYKIVESLAPERLPEFTAYYLIDPKRKNTDKGNYVLQDYIKGMGARTNISGKPLWNTHNIAIARIVNQVQIIDSLSSRIDSVLQDVKGHLFAELQDSELEAAKKLKTISPRAAGAVAGVILERHLQRTAQNHGITIGRKVPTISNLNDPLRQANVIDVPTWRKIQLLADLRNLCSHQKATEPTDEQVDELIIGVNSIIKSVF